MHVITHPTYISRSLVAKRTHEGPVQPPLEGAALMSPYDDGALETPTRQSVRSIHGYNVPLFEAVLSPRASTHARGLVRASVSRQLVGRRVGSCDSSAVTTQLCLFY
jgi:hypothetical protein